MSKQQTILFIHGGPGMDSSYLRPWFKSLDQDYDLIFPDQHGCGKRNETTSLQETVDDFINLINGHVPSVIIAHSWGSYLFLLLLQKTDFPFIDKVIFISPMNLSKERADLRSKELKEQISDADSALINDFIERQTCGPEFLKLIEKYYVYDPAFKLGIYGDMKYDVWRAINDNLKNTDVHSVIKKLPPTMILYGELEEVDLEWRNCDTVQEIQSVRHTKHYCFAEQNEQTILFIRKFLDINPANAPVSLEKI